MKKIILLSFIVIMWGGCQTSPKKEETSEPNQQQAKFETFSLQKITEKGIQEVQISASDKAWPAIEYKSLKPIAYKAKNIKIAVLGDTGCRLKESKSGARYQECNNPLEWPYAEISKVIANEKYDFAIHTGDYHYREQCSDPKLCPKITKSTGYGWAAWWDDFYNPTQSLFKRSPMLFVRGNHEDCERAFSGWAPLSVVNKNFGDTCEQIEAYQWIEMDDLVLINFDDSAFEDRQKLNAEDRAKWVQVFQKMNERLASVKGKKEIWFLAHRPVLGFVPNPEDAEPMPMTDNLKTVLAEAKTLPLLDYYLSGHIHNQQVVTTDKRAIQVIVGNTATGLDPFGRKIMSEKVISTTETKRSFGYAIFERTGFKKWRWQFKNQNGRTELDCKVKGAEASCDFIN